MTFINHYGFWVDSEEPVTGVYSVNKINWEYLDNDICLDCEEYINEIHAIQDCPECEALLDEDGDCQECGWSKQKIFDFMECDGSHQKIIGDWKLVDGIYEANKEKGEFFGILHEFTIQVLWSKFVKRGAICSPCFAGQVDADSIGEFSYYALPEEMIYKDEEENE